MIGTISQRDGASMRRNQTALTSRMLKKAFRCLGSTKGNGLQRYTRGQPMAYTTFLREVTSDMTRQLAFEIPFSASC